ncbi:hypothetical protein EH227_04730 [Rouxiella chamberiensis]|nr:hypothetical protein EH227_04730 [Rouxiella chamberiensis]
MTGTVPSVLTDSESKILHGLLDRLNWNMVKPILQSFGFSLGRGKDATLNKIKTDLIELKDKDNVKFENLKKKINDILFSQFIYGEKAIFSLTIDKPIMDSIKSALVVEWGSTPPPSAVDDFLLSDIEIATKRKNELDLVFFSQDSSQGVALFSSVREQIIKEKIPPLSLPQYKGYDEIIAKKKEKMQCFDVCLFDYNNNTVNILIDYTKNTIGDSVLFAKSVVVRKLYDYAGGQFSITEKDFFPLIDPIFNQNTQPFLGSDYKVFELSFLTPEGTTHQEKKKDPTKDLREDLFNLEGIKAVGQIGLYRIGIRISRKNVALQLDDNVELTIPGTLRRHLGGTGSSSINYAIINNCLNSDDFERLIKLIV